jgi:hypothetical protein
MGPGALPAKMGMAGRQVRVVVLDRFGIDRRPLPQARNQSDRGDGGQQRGCRRHPELRTGLTVLSITIALPAAAARVTASRPTSRGVLR